jgi:hypothetical protein
MNLRLFLTIAFCSLMFSGFSQINSVGLIGSASPFGWDADTNLVKSNDSIYTLKINLVAGECKFRANDAWDINWGDVGFPFGAGTQGGANIPVKVAGEYSIDFNAFSGAYEFEITSPIGIIGNSTPKGWDEDTNMFQDSIDDNKFYIVLNLKLGEAKFRFNDDWARNWGAKGFPTGVGVQNGDNIPVTAAGRYRIDFDTLTGAYAFTEIPEFKTISIIGNGTPGGWTNDTPLKKDAANPDLWTGNVDLTDGFAKFRADSAWTYNWGGTTFPSGVATPNGGDIPVTAGRYQISFNVKTLEYNFLLIPAYSAIGIIGTANPGGFDTPTPLTADPDNEGVWKVRVVLLTGDAYFKADDDLWAGSGFPNGTAEIDGAPIPVPAGEYKISFNTITGAYSFEQLVIYSTVGLIGPATPLATWDTDVDMIKDANDEMFWYIPSILLNEGECKFRAEDAWAVNWGAKDVASQEDAAGIGAQDGPNFKVKAGIYGVTLRAVKNEGEYVFGPELKAGELLNYSVVKLFPNPVSDKLNIEITEAKLRGELNVTIFSNQGARVYSNTMNIQEQASIQIGDLTPGVYWLHMTNGTYIVGKQFIVTK